MKYYICSVLILLTLACGEESNSGESLSANPPSPPNGSTITDRAGPMSVIGSRWTTGPQVVNDFELELVAEFTDTEIILSTICERTQTVSARSPIKYTYSVQVTQGNRSETRNGDQYCEVSIEPTQFNFEQAGDDLLAYDGSESILFEGTPGNQGLYGQWSFRTDVGTLTWWMGNNTLTARSECANGLSAQTQTGATYKNFFSIQESAESGDESCNVFIDTGDLEYRVEGDELVFLGDDETTRLTRY